VLVRSSAQVRTETLWNGGFAPAGWVNLPATGFPSVIAPRKATTRFSAASVVGSNASLRFAVAPTTLRSLRIR
jgi:hypothetical protein